MQNTIIGIDFGTTNTVVSFLNKYNSPQTLLIDGKKLLPTVISLENKKYKVGISALQTGCYDNTSVSVKRKIGTTAKIKIANMIFSPEQIYSLIFEYLKIRIKDLLAIKSPKIRAVITIPAYFTQTQRRATEQAATKSGFVVERIINEPTAAALSFGIHKLRKTNFAIYDLGGGTFDVSIIRNNYSVVEVLATNGDFFLGGDDFDNLLMEYISKKTFKNIHTTLKSKALNNFSFKLKRLAEQVKIQLSKQEIVKLNIPDFIKGVNLVAEIERSDFEGIISPKIERTIKLLNQAVEDAGLEMQDLNGIILVGGSSKIPFIAKSIEENTGITPNHIPLPDEAVSHGATIQGAIIDKINVDIVLVDITAHSLGIQTYEHQEGISQMIMSFIIDKNTPVPVKKTRIFDAVMPYQNSYKIKIFQGENKFPEENIFVGEVIFEVEKPMPQDAIEVTFHLDINGILKMSAVQLATKKKIKADFLIH